MALPFSSFDPIFRNYARNNSTTSLLCKLRSLTFNGNKNIDLFHNFRLNLHLVNFISTFIGSYFFSLLFGLPSFLFA